MDLVVKLFGYIAEVYGYSLRFPKTQTTLLKATQKLISLS